MFREYLQLELKEPHDKQSYCLRRNELVIRESSQSVKFDSICYSSEDIMSKVVYDAVTVFSAMLRGGGERASLTVTFNYDLRGGDLVMLVAKLLAVKMFVRLQMGHFQIKNGHISDYNKNGGGVGRLVDDLDQFEKDIDNSLKLDRIWKINEYLSYRSLSAASVGEQLQRTSKKFGKRTNEFFVLQVEGRLRIVLILLPRSREMVLTREQQRQIEQLYILRKHAVGASRRTICFSTPIAQIINNYLDQAGLNVLVSCFPQQGRPLGELLQLPLRLSHPCEQEIQRILEGYNRDKSAQLESEVERWRRRSKETQYSVKSEEDTMQRLSKLYAKSFGSTFAGVQYLHKRGVTSLPQHIAWLRGQIHRKEGEVQAQEQVLREMHTEIILEEKRHLFYVNKISQYKGGIQLRQKTRKAAGTPGSIKVKSDSLADAKETELSEEELLYFYDPVKELGKYRERKEEEIRRRLNASSEKREFLRLLEEARLRLSKPEYNSFEQQFYDLIVE